jgi:hypothetical protein
LQLKAIFKSNLNFEVIAKQFFGLSAAAKTAKKPGATHWFECRLQVESRRSGSRAREAFVSGGLASDLVRGLPH